MDRRDGLRGVVTSSAEETFECAQAFAKTLKVPAVICLFGDLGAGKTTFVKGLAAGIGAASHSTVNSPTFQYLNIYSGTVPLYHFDLYRLKSTDDFVLLGFDEFFGQGIVCIEWAEKIKAIIPKNAIKITLSYEGEGRKIEIAIP